MTRIEQFLQRIPVRLLLILPALFYLTVALYWQSKGFYHINGDEPHYLLISDSIVRDGDLLVENNYFTDTSVRRSSPIDLSAPGHVDLHTHNRYSTHNVGLPLVLALPYSVAGVAGAKIFMALLACLWPLLFYRVLLRITGSRPWSALAAFALGAGLPFVAAGNQIYPDLPAGMLILYAAERIFRVLEGEDEPAPSLRSYLSLGAAIGFLPWLHVRMLAPAVILLIGYTLAVKRRRRAKTRSQLLLPAAIVLGSITLLIVSNQLFYGNLLGLHGEGTFTYDLKKIAMIFLGLHWDQSQGMFMQQPLLLLGLVGLVPLVKANWRGAALLGILYLSLIVPNSMHPVWYGAFSFAGRFGWAATALWVFPLAYAIKSLLKRSEAAVLMLCMGSIALQAWLAAHWLLNDEFLVNHRLPVWAARTFYDSTGLLLQLPTFKDFDLYLRHPSNYVFLLGGILLIVTGWLWQRGRFRVSGAVWAAALVLGASVLLFAPPAVSSWTIAAKELPSEVGTVEGTSRVATENDKAGSLVFGPYVMLLAGDYEATLDYESDDEEGLPPPRYDIVYGQELMVVADSELPPSGTNGGVLKRRFKVRESQSLKPLFQFRVRYPGHGTLKVKSLTLRPVPVN
ncbi:MAG TPA: hypothetical protein VF791_01535 [Pyrinomonadaceae bacterium]